jgi:ABC-2 type transport system ATP-binding protein
MIDIENLHLNIEGNEILKGIDLRLRPGDIYGLLGPNGAGKSTTTFALLGLRAYGSDLVSVLGGNPAENAGFYDWMTTPAYLKWCSRLYDSPQTDRDLGIGLEKVGLGAEVRRPIGTYSRRMKQRLAMARAFVGPPSAVSWTPSIRSPVRLTPSTASLSTANRFPPRLQDYYW